MIQHLACLMDGNRRWATAHGMEKIQGHTKGIDTVKIVTEFCLQKKIPYLSLYTLSAENLNRSEQEKNHIFSLMVQNFQEGSQLLQDCLKNGVRIRFIGDRTLIPLFLLPVCDRVEKQTAHLSALNLNFMFCYGARQEIVHAAKKLVQNFARDVVSLKDLEDISVDSFKNYLWTGDMPDPDLVIRTGNAVRLSNFMLYQTAYSEWYFSERMWPDMQHEDFQAALDDFIGRQRRFGR